MSGEPKNFSGVPATRREFIASAAAFLACAATAGCGSDKPPANEENRGDDKRFDGQDSAARVAKPRSTAVPLDKQASRSSPKGKFVWKTVASGNEGPGARSRHELAFDAGDNSLLLFGGVDWSGWGGRLLGDTWIYRDGKWSQAHSAASPSARHRGAMVYDPLRGCCVLFGGQGRSGLGYSCLADTWTFAGGQWKHLSLPAASRPTPRCGHSLAFDEKEGLTVLFGGVAPGDKSLADTWTFDGGAWTHVSGDGPTPRRYAAFAYDPDLEGCVLQGGSADDNGEQTYGETWLFREQRWQYLAKTMDATPCDDQALGYHRAAERLVMCGGLLLPQALLLRSPGGWVRAAAESMPPRHQCAPMVWHPALNGLVLHGGETGQRGKQFDATWLLEFVSEKS